MFEENAKPLITVSVRNFVEFLLRNGNIDNRTKGSASDVETMQEGARIHRMIQRRMDLTYHAEVPVFNIHSFDDYDLRVEGRADGIIEGNPITIDEIKTTHRDLIKVTHADPIHLAQAKCYAYFVIKELNEKRETDELYEFDQMKGLNGLRETDELYDSDQINGLNGLRETDEPYDSDQMNGLNGLRETDELYESDQMNGLNGLRETDELYDSDQMNGLDGRNESEKSADSGTKNALSSSGKAIVTAHEIEVSGNRIYDEITVRLTYCNAETLECKYFHETYTYAEITAFYMELVMKYKKWADFELSWPSVRDKSISEMTFPFEFRAGQKELIGQIYHTISTGNRLFVEAPTGTGKTIATLYPSIKAIGEGKGRRIFYLTAKTITRTAACDCVDLLREKALRLKSVVITAKEKICACTDNLKCNPDDCPYANGHFDRINDAVYDLLVSEDSFTREKVMEYANKHMVCPFEMCLDMSLFSDVIICDYNYVFDPNVYLRRFFSEGIRDDYIFLVDEAHNLVERAMSMYSADLTKEEMLSVKNIVKPFDARLARALEGCNKKLLELKKECEKCQVLEGITPFVIAMNKAQVNFERFLDENENCPDKEKVLDLYFKVRHFLNMYENMTDEDYLIYDRINENGEFMLKLLCTNPARSLRTCLDKGISTVFFSATLLPIQYFKDMLTGEEDSAVYAKSVFDPNKRGLFIARDVSSKYTRRTENEYMNIASYIDKAVRSHHGNYIVFFPSYSFMQSVLGPFEDFFVDDEICLLTQNPRMSEEERERFLSCFKDGITDMGFKSLVGFCVMGGIFSEGIDLKGDNLIGSIIIGTGLPMVQDEREILKNKYDEEGFNGFDYAYRYPGMNKVLQAAGRVIRTEEDTGIVMLLDERFHQQSYIKLFPREWSNARTVSVNTVKSEVESFWQDIKNR